MKALAAASLLLLGLLAPAQAQLPDHLKCYSVRDSLASFNYTADLSGLASETGCTIKMPAKYFCVESAKTITSSPPPPGASPGPIPGRVLCYKARCPTTPTTLPSSTVADQFGIRTLTPKKTTMLCAPEFVTGHTTTTSTSTSSTTSTTAPICTPSIPCISGCFEDWGDGTIRDTCTNLQWEKKDTAVGSGVNAADLHDVDNVYSWAGRCSVNTSKLCQPTAAAETLCQAQTPAAYWANGCQQCTGGDGTCNVDPFSGGAITTVWSWLDQVRGNFAGYSDWRLPSEDGCNSCIINLCDTFPGYSDTTCCSPSDLETILVDGGPVFPCGPHRGIASLFGPTAFEYWSASAFPPGSGVWSVNLGDGYVEGTSKPFAHYVRAVR